MPSPSSALTPIGPGLRVSGAASGRPPSSSPPASAASASSSWPSACAVHAAAIFALDLDLSRPIRELRVGERLDQRIEPINLALCRIGMPAPREPDGASEVRNRLPHRHSEGWVAAAAPQPLPSHGAPAPARLRAQPDSVAAAQTGIMLARDDASSISRAKIDRCRLRICASRR